MSDHDNKCDKENVITQLLKVQAQISVTPLVKHGNPKVYCMKSCIKPIFDRCDHKCCDCKNVHHECGDWDSDYDTAWEPGRSKNKCNFTLTQLICVEIPISIDADVDIDEGIVCCSKPELNPKI